MKVAVSSTGTQLSSTVDPRFGRAAYLVIVETETGEIDQVIDNLAARDAAHGAGINAASRIAEAGAKAILTGHVGPKAAAVCEKAGIAMIHDITGTVKDAVNFYSSQKQISSSAQTQQATSPFNMNGQGYGGGKGRGQGRGQGCGGGTGRGQGRGQGQRGPVK